MEELNLKLIEKQIDYKFNNVGLLRQAFTRKSYAQENGGTSNEVLEFFGDEVLDYYVSKILANHFGHIKGKEEYLIFDDGYNNEYITDDNITESDLTTIKKDIVDNEHLAKLIENYGFQKYLLLGKGDQKKNVQNEIKVKADLFEAILGAVAIDSEWNNEILETTVKLMLNLEFYLDNGITSKDDYVSIIQHWWQTKIGDLPVYQFEEKFNPLMGLMNYNKTKYYIASIGIIIENQRYSFSGEGETKSTARYKCAEELFKFLNQNNLLESVTADCPSEDELIIDIAINVLQELAQKGLCSMPKYDYEKDPTYDSDGNPLWSCTCCVKSHNECWTATCTSKKEAKKYAAYLCIIDMKGYKNKYE